MAGKRGSAPGRVPSVEASAEREQEQVSAPATAHEDLAVFTRVGVYLEELEAETARRAEQRGPHGRRFARLRTAIEDALLQARQGVHEAQHGQSDE